MSFSTGYNTENGYAARWTNVTASDGEVSIESAWDPDQGSGNRNTQGYAMAAIKLEESPDERSALCTIPLQMIWEDDGRIVRREPYDFHSDRCDGLRCALSAGSDISPACFNEAECQRDCGGRCLSIADMQALCR